MKPICFFIIILLSSLSAMSQQFTVSDSVNVTLPEGSSIVSKDSATAILKKKFPGDQYVSDLVNPGTDYVYYDVKGNILEFSYKSIDGRGTYLSNMKPKYDAVGVEDGMNASVHYTSGISTTKLNVPVLLMYQTDGVVATYRFISCNPLHIGRLDGVLHFPVEDKGEVTTILNTILNTIYFNSK